ncbi:hypothetical protein Rruber_04690 [Rhodococcus ruber]
MLLNQADENLSDMHHGCSIRGDIHCTERRTHSEKLFAKERQDA